MSANARVALIATNLLGTAGASLAADETFLFRISAAVSTPAAPVVEVTILAAFDPADYAFARASLQMAAADGEFFGAGCLLNCGIAPPVVDGRFVRGISVSQFGWPPDVRNPIPIAVAQWRPESHDTRDVRLDTITGSFWVYPTDTSSIRASRMSTFTEGAAIIRVRRCYADCDGTDDLDFFDFLCFQNAFATGDFYADCDGSGELDFFDFLCFQNEFALGCE